MRIWMLLVVFTAALAVAACTAPPPAPLVPASSLSTLPKELGEDAGWTNEDGSAVDFYVDKITVDPPCDPDGDKPDGHTLVLDLRVVTGSPGSALRDAAYVLNPNRFEVVDPDGMLQPATIGTCEYATTVDLPPVLAADHTYHVQLELDAPQASGELLLVVRMQNNDAWEWHYGNSVEHQA